jgi:DNA-binding response OmpR family regulator
MLLIRLMAREPRALPIPRVLCVDTDRHVQGRIRQALEHMFSVHCVSSLEEARRYLLEEPPDLVICETALGGEDGLELCRFVREEASLRHLPVMILTSQMTLQDKIAGFAAGADDYVVKPFDARHLAARVRLLLRIKQLELRNQD